ncbi:MAG: aspartate aminotransferase family protein [Candidatus Kariarchaeaceae archaeon]
MTFLEDEVKEFRKNHKRSELLWERSKKALAGGVSHNIRNFGLPLVGGFPIFITKANRNTVTDIDGHDYVDYWGGHFSQLIGHNDPRIREVVENRLQKGWHPGMVIEEQTSFAERIIENSPSVEKVRFCTSGTEATMYATRLARSYTNRKMVAKAKLGWHGANDTLFYNVSFPYLGRDTPGIHPINDAGIITFDINSEATFDQLKRYKNELAAVIIEPVLGGGGGITVSEDFLKQIREITEEYGIVLILDEIITGYRYHYGLYQDIIGIKADLTTMGKIISGGFPVGVIGGNNDILNLADPTQEETTLIGGGTFSAFPLSMAAGLKTFDILENSTRDYERINKLGENALIKLNKIFQGSNSNFIAVGKGSMVFIHSIDDLSSGQPINESITNKNREAESLLQLSLLNRNFIGYHGLGGLNFCHVKDDIEKTIQAISSITDFF